MKPSPDEGIFKFLRHGAATASELTARLGISQPTLSRRLAPLIDSGDVVRIGRGKSTRYAWRRRVPGLPATGAIPVYLIDEKGAASLLCSVSPVEPEGTVISPDNRMDPLRSLVEHQTPGLPYFLEYLRPEGFLGRNLVRSLAAGSGFLSNDARNWSEDQLLYFLYHHGMDLPGNIVFGRDSLTRLSVRDTASDRGAASDRKDASDWDGAPGNGADRIAHYERLADRAIDGEAPGSSAGGEQPKFTAWRRDEQGNPVHVIVKFSPEKSEDTVTTRWTDLLIAEWTALDLLSRNGHGGQSVQMIEGQQRWMLEIQRYDRVGEQGRRPWISLGAINDDLYGHRDSMQRALSRLFADELISEKDYRRAMIVSVFGDFIGNTDQHFGNLSFTWQQNSSRLNIAPFYDVLPMFYAPRSGGEILEDRFHSMPVRFPEEPDFYDSALPLAHEYWQILAEDRRLSDSFRKLARGVQSRLPD